MAVRINVTAVRGCPADEVRAVFAEVIKPPCPPQDGTCPVPIQVETAEHGGWVWFTTSVWGVSAADLNRGLCRLARPGLQFTTSDGSRWYLTIHGGPQGQVHFLHEFGTHDHEHTAGSVGEEDEYRVEEPEVDPGLAFLEDDPPPGRPAGPKSRFERFADEQAEMGPGFPDEFRAVAASLEYHDALNRFREWHAAQVVAALAGAGIPRDPAAVRAVLLWEGVTENERDSDLGNLPRLLSVLGLGRQWDDWVRDAEKSPEPEPAGEAEPPPPPEDEVGPARALVEPLPLSPVARGPVPLPVRFMTRTTFFPEACGSGEPKALVAVDWGSGFDPGEVELAEGAAGRVQWVPGGVRVGLSDYRHFTPRNLGDQLGRPLRRLLARLPDGATLDIGFANPDAPAQNQRYRGTVIGGVWRIDSTHPPLSREVLAEALELAAKPGKGRARCGDEAEATALVAAAATDPNLTGGKLRQKGRLVRIDYDFVGNLPKLLFRMRYGGWWDVSAAVREVEEEFRRQREQARQMRRAGAEAARRRAAPREAVALYDGEQSRYWRSDIELLADLEQETREQYDATLAGLGFRFVGDLVAKKQRDIVLRIHLSADGYSYGVLMAKRTMYLGYEYVSRFADGSVLTTTTNAAVDSHPDVGVFYKTCPGMSAADLYGKHLWGIGRLRSARATEPMPLDGTLLGVAKELDAAFARRAGAG
ncbi:MAG: hypothetical protein K2X82_01830 [Gemmataceae bacterium]|nr:hypothetical protein [Gemmataceae bacterium]